MLFGRINNLYRAITNAGVDQSVSPLLSDRIVFSNIVYLVGTAMNATLSLINLHKGYYFYLGMNGVYQLGLVVGFLLNLKKRYLLGRVFAIVCVFAGFFLSAAVQGTVLEMEHFFLPVGVMAFAFFFADERRYGFFFLAVCILSYAFFASRETPLLTLSPAFGHDKYAPEDIYFNRFGYLTLLFGCMAALSNAYHQALRTIDAQKNKLFEERRMAALGAIACNVAHEVNTPLTALDLHLFQLEGILKKGDFPAAATEKLAKASRISRRISVIVRGLKFLSGQDENDPVAKRELAAIIDLAVDLNQDRLDKHGIRLMMKLEDPKQVISCKSVALSQVFVNLLNNAVEAVMDLPAPNRWIEIRSAIRHRTLEISITDGGRITCAQTRENLFTSFYTTKPPGMGTGLGLSIAKETVEGHRGELRFSPESPHTQFIIRLPIEPVEPLASVPILTPPPLSPPDNPPPNWQN